MFSNRLHVTLLGSVLGCMLTSLSWAASPPDPLDSPMWDYLLPRFMGEDPYEFDNQVLVTAPDFAEDPTRVPIFIDATAVKGTIEKIVVWSDLNPIQHILTYYHHDELIPKFGLNFRVQQGTPIRAAAKTTDGIWHVGYTEIEAEGGGCTAPTHAAANPYWENHLGEFETALFKRSQSERFKFRIIHPMDTGLVDAVPEFYLENLEIRDGAGKATAHLELSPPISENPVFTFEFAQPDQPHSLWMRDNGGNIFEAQL